MSFAFDLAWNVKSIPADGFLEYFEHLASREFGPQYAKQIAGIWNEFDRLVALRKQEHIESDIFSILRYDEAEKVISRWQKVSEEAEAIHAVIPQEQRPAFFELVVHPVKASYIFNLLRYTQSKNQLFGKQRRNTTNGLFQECIRLFDADFDLTQEYHSLLNGKWNHILRQPHYGYSTSGLGPSRNMIEGLYWVQTRMDSNPSVGHMGVAVEGQEGHDPGICNEDSDRTHPSRKWLEAGLTLPPISPYGPQTRYFEIFHRGTVGFDWELKPQHSWINVSQSSGTLNPQDSDVRIVVTIDWAEVPAGFDEKTYIEVIGSVDGYEQVRLVVQNREAPDKFTGFVEAVDYVSIHPGNWAAAPYIRLPALGRQDPGSVILSSDTDFKNPDEIPYLRYDIYTFTDHEETNLELHFNMTLETDPNSFMEYDVRWDDGPTQRYRLTEDSDSGYFPLGWSDAVRDCVWKNRHGLGSIAAGSHVLEVKFRNPNMSLEKVVVDLGAIDMTYLGPPESTYVSHAQDSREEVREVSEEDVLQIDLQL